MRFDAAVTHCPALLCHRYRCSSSAPSLCTRDVRNKVASACTPVKARKHLVISEQRGVRRRPPGERPTPNFGNRGAGRQANDRRRSLLHRCGSSGLQVLVTGSSPRSTVAVTTAARQNGRHQRVPHARITNPAWPRFRWPCDHRPSSDWLCIQKLARQRKLLLATQIYCYLVEPLINLNLS